MSYSSLVQRLFSVNFFGGMKLGLQNCRILQTFFDYPDRRYPVIHVAGTNGKGSVTTKIAAALEAEGYRVGLYTSPHISCFRERICVNRKMIPEDVVQEILTDLFEITKKNCIPATFFELTTFLALIYFAREQADVVVLETGLGGRLDATNIVDPVLCVITSISLDHTDILGTSIEEITREKAGIIKPGVPVLIGPQVPFSIVKETAERQNSFLFQVPGEFSTFEEENRTLAKKALRLLHERFPISKESIRTGIETNRPCRFEIFRENNPIILDVAHNPDGLLHLFRAIRIRFGQKPLRILFGLSKNKDVDGCLKILNENTQDFHLVEAPNGRGLPVCELRARLLKHETDPKRIHIDSSIGLSLSNAIQKAEESGQILVLCGSFFIMSEIRRSLGFREPRDDFDMNERILPVRV